MKQLHYGWVMVYSAIGILAVHSLTFYSFGIFLKPVTEEFSWERGAMALATSITMIVSGPLSLLAGRISDRYGPRLLLTASGFFVGIGFLLMSRISALWQVYLFYGVIIAIGNSTCVVPLTSTIPRWFTRRRGTAIGLTWTGIGLGGVTAPILVQWLIGAFDWRWAYIVLAILNFVILIPLAQALKRAPEVMGLKPYGEEPATAQVSQAIPVTGNTFKETIKSVRFWLLGVMLFSFVFIGQTMMSHLAPHAVDTGIPATTAASFISLLAATSLIGRNISGVIADRISARKGMLIGACLITVNLTWLVFARETWMFYAFAALYGISFGIVVPLQTLLPGELFGLKSLGIISATVMLLGGIGGAVGAPLAGAIFDAQHSYRMAFFICMGLGALAVVAGSLLLRLRESGSV